MQHLRAQASTTMLGMNEDHEHVIKSSTFSTDAETDSVHHCESLARFGV
jgi:hypothetical protein